MPQVLLVFGAGIRKYKSKNYSVEEVSHSGHFLEEVSWLWRRGGGTFDDYCLELGTKLIATYEFLPRPDKLGNMGCYSFCMKKCN